MKKAIILFVFILTALWLAAQAPDWLWAKQSGGTGLDEGYSIATDSSGNSYITGTFTGNATFGTITLVHSGTTYPDIFIAKLDSNGNYLWANQAGGTSDDVVRGIAIDSSGNSYLTGYFYDTATFGTITLTSCGDYDIFIAKLDTNGNWLWVKQAGGTARDFGYWLATDSSGNCYVTGHFYDSATFGTITLTNCGGRDIFIAKLDTNGNWLWAKQAGGTDSDFGYGIASDSFGNSYVTGPFSDTAIFGSISLTSSGYDDIFISKLDTNGNWLWARQAGGTDVDFGTDIATDSSGNSYLTGRFSGTATFGTTSLINSGSSDIFITKLDTNGTYLWVRQVGGTISNYVGGIATDSSGNSFMTGYFSGTATFGNTPLTSRGRDDIFIAKFDTNGNWLWAKQAGGASGDYGCGIAIDSSGNSYLTGYFSGTATFGSNPLTSSGDADIFIAKLSNPTSVSDEYQVPQALFSLGQNHPNPFITSTSFEIEVSDAKSIYKVSVYDLRGRHIRTLHQGILPTGKRSFTWSGKDSAEQELSSGVYLYRVSDGITSQVKKMIYVK